MNTLRRRPALLLTLVFLFLASCTDEIPVAPDLSTDEESFIAASKHVPPGQVETVLSLPAGESPEGIILDQYGNIYIGVRQTSETSQESRILKIAPNGAVSIFATLPPASPEASGVLGLGIDPSGNVYAALVTQDPATHGVWRVRRSGGDSERLAGSENMIFPNALTFDNRGNLYVTDSFGGAVWRYGRDRRFSLWIQDDLLAPLDIDPFGFPAPGANGIAFDPPNLLYVANTEKGLVARIRIAPDGSAETLDVVAGGGPTSPLTSVDGIAVDVKGHIYGVIPPSTLEELGAPPLPPLVKLDPNTGVVTPVVTDASAFDTPTSLAFGRGRRDHKSVFIANAALFGPGLGAGPGVVQVGVGVAGFPRRVEGLGTDDDMTLFAGEFTYAADPAMGVVPCRDPSGNAAPGLALPVKANVDGRASHLEKTTGYFTTSECLAQADGSLASAGDWVFIGADGHRVMGTWTATTLSDGSLTGKTVITGGIGSFADATGWTRFTGQIDLAAGTGTFYGKGVISRPKEVTARGIVTELSATSQSGSVSCMDANGNVVFNGTRRFEAEGLTSLGPIQAVIVNERCTSDASGIETFHGRWEYTFAQGDILRGTSEVVIGVSEPWPNDSIITGGTGRFEGATGWMNGTVDPSIGIWLAAAEGVVFIPR